MLIDLSIRWGNERMWLYVLAISGGAALGANARWLLGLWLNALFPALPLGTLAAIGLSQSHIGYCPGQAAVAVVERVQGYKPEVCSRSSQERISVLTISILVKPVAKTLEL